MRQLRRLTLLIVLTIPLLLALGSGPGGWGFSQSVRAQGGVNQVGLVVRFGDGSLTTRCVEFSEQQISGYDVLVRSGLDIVAAFDSGAGAAICAIEGEGCPANECLTCADPNYWSYWHLVEGSWVYSQVGSSGYAAHHGDVEGWSWGPGEPPPVVFFAQICIPPATDTPPPTDTPLPPTATSPPPTPVVWFRLDDNPIPAGTCTNVRWDTSNAQEVYLDGERVDAIGSREVCPTAPQEYHLRVVDTGEDETIYTLVLGVTGTPPSPTFTPCPTSDATAALTLTPTQCPTRTPAPTTPVATASQPAATSPQPVAQVTTPASASRQPTNQPTSQPTGQPPATANIPSGYAVFGIITVGLLGLLVFGLLRRK